jgi:hypothetical protein
MGYASSGSKTNVMAVVSLVSAIMSWFLLPFIGAIVAIVTGHMARGQISNSHGAETGDGLALAGLILGYLQLLMSCAGIFFFLLFFGSLIGLSGCAILADSASYVPPLP